MPDPPFLAEKALCGDATFSPGSTIFVDSAGRVHESKYETGEYLNAEFDLGRLDQIHDLLWWAGRPVPARPLHHQRVRGREVVITERIDMHLVWTLSRVFLKPIPRFLLGHHAWHVHLRGRHKLHKTAAGFLLSYVWLIRHESDLHLAREHGLIPQNVTMEAWNEFVNSLLSHIDPNALDQVDRRFLYGELRLDRLNQIYRLAPRFLFRNIVFGYGLYPASYGRFLQKNFGWLLVAFAYAAIVLNALQVGLATAAARSSQGFEAAAWGFSIFSIVAPVTAAAVALVLHLTLFTYHLSETILHGKMRKRERTNALHQRRHSSP